MPGTKVTVAMVATGAIGIGVIAYKFNKFKKDYVKAREESRRRAQDRWESFLAGVQVTAIGGCVLLGVAGYYSYKS